MQTALASSLIQRARYAADAETPTPTTDFITDVESLTYLTNSYRKLLDLIIDSGGQDLVTTFATLTSPSYTLPATFYRVAGLDAQIDSNRWSALPRFMFQERNRRSVDTSFPFWRIIGTTLMFDPPNATPTPLRLWYIAELNVAAATTDVVQTFGGWDEYLVMDMASQMLLKEERDSSAVDGRFAQAMRRIQTACRELSVHDVEHVSKTEFLPEEAIDFLTWEVL